MSIFLEQKFCASKKIPFTNYKCAFTMCGKKPSQTKVPEKGHVPSSVNAVSCVGRCVKQEVNFAVTSFQYTGATPLQKRLLYETKRQHDKVHKWSKSENSCNHCTKDRGQLVPVESENIHRVASYEPCHRQPQKSIQGVVHVVLLFVWAQHY